MTAHTERTRAWLEERSVAVVADSLRAPLPWADKGRLAWRILRRR